MADDTIDVGARVRFKGDYGVPGYPPTWMTVARLDDIPAGPAGPGGRFISVAIPTVNEGGGPWLQVTPGIMAGAVTTQAPAPAQPTKRRAR